MSSWFHLARLPEPELMDESAEVEAYASAAAQKYLQTIDQTFVDHASRLIGNHNQDRVLDLGCGPGQIPIMLAQRFPQLEILGVDAAPHMIEQARHNAAAAGARIGFEVLRVGANSKLPFADATFGLVICNSVLHHLSDPIAALNEIERVAKSGCAVLIRDLRRPSALAAPWHIRWNGRHYRGEMRRLYEASVRAAYTFGELQELLRESRLNDGRARVFRHQRTHIGIERPAQR